MDRVESKPIVALWIISLVAALDTLGAVVNTDGWMLGVMTLGSLIAALLAESLLLLIVGIRAMPARLQPILAAVLATINLISVKMAFSAELLLLDRPLKIELVLAIATVLYLITAQAWALQKRVLFPLAMLMVLFVTTQPLIKKWSAPPPASAYTDYNGIRMKDRPNIHVIIFDSMISDAIARKHLGRPASYQDFLDKNAIVFRNAFSVYVPTKASISAFLRLDDDRFQGYQYFSGIVLSPIFSILKNNEYRITTGAINGYLGPRGPYVDDYYVDGEAFGWSTSAMCLDSSSFLRIPRFFGVCEIRSDLPTNPPRWLAQVRAAVAQPRRTRPAFTFHYTNRPIGHTSLSFDRKSKEDVQDYSDFFAKQAKVLANELVALKADVMKADPEAIVIIFGDHGIWLSRNEEYEDDPRFVTLDRHAISLSVLKTNHRCTRDTRSIGAYTSVYATPSRVFAGILRCLAGDPRTVDNAVHFSTKRAFERFRYEN